MFLERSGSQHILLPEIRLQVSIRVAESVKQGLDEVTHGTGMSTSRGVAVINSSHGQQPLAGGRGDKSGTARSGDETNTDGSTLSSHLGGDSVRHTALTSPVSATDGGDIQLGSQNST